MQARNSEVFHEERLRTGLPVSRFLAGESESAMNPDQSVPETIGFREFPASGVRETSEETDKLILPITIYHSTLVDFPRGAGKRCGRD